MVRQNLIAMYATLFLIGVALFCYLMYVLVKPEKF